MVKKWKFINERFTNKLQKDWENGFSTRTCREWMDAGLKITDAGYARWLKYVKKIGVEYLLNDNKQELRKEYEEFLEEIKNGSKISAEAIKKIKDFEHSYCDSPSYYNGTKFITPKLTPEQELSVDKLISNEKLRNRYKLCGLCKECNQPNTSGGATGNIWCRTCNYQHLQENKGVSKNKNIDDFIRQHQLKATKAEQVFEWIPYEQFTEIEHIADGGFGKVYKAKWLNGLIVRWDTKHNEWEREKDEGKNYKMVALKILNDSQNISKEFLQEIANHKLFSFYFDGVVSCYGISRNPETKNYIMVMQYMDGGSLRDYLNRNGLKFKDKIYALWTIAYGLEKIHRKGLVHKDFHVGNILNDLSQDVGNNCYIADLGLCQPANETDKSKVYGVLPYVAPEVLRGQPYTQVSDIYSFGIIAYEMFTSLPPYHNRAHDTLLTINICEGLRPSLQIKIPQLLQDLIKKCWDADPRKRPNAKELEKDLDNWSSELTHYYECKKDSNGKICHTSFCARKDIDEESTEFIRQCKHVLDNEKEKLCQALSQLYHEYKGQSKEVKVEELTAVENELFSEFCRRGNFDSKLKGAREFFKRIFPKETNSVFQNYSTTVSNSKLINTKQTTQ